MPTRTPLSQVVAAMRNTAPEAGNFVFKNWKSRGHRGNRKGDDESAILRRGPDLEIRRVVLCLVLLVRVPLGPLPSTATTAEHEGADQEEHEGHRGEVQGNRLEKTGEHDARRLDAEVRLRRRLMSCVVDRPHLG